jgi:2-polyprenyl-6-methoxyphenol hydroxylase-like FAD-dependent oxidoreductase
MQTEATALIRQGGRIAGVQAQTPQGRLEIRCELLVAADGRHSILRKDAGLEVIESGAPMDVLWMRLPRHSSDQDQTLGRVGAGHILVMLNRGNYWQCALVIRKGGYQEIRERGLEAFRNKIIALAPYLKDRTDQLRDWDEIKLLTVTVDHLRQWQLPGFLCIGDSAHAMSPIGGVGVNLAIQDAVAAANLLAEPLLHDTLTFDALRAVQERRQLPTFMTQRLQLLVQNRIIGRVLASGEDPAKALTAPWPLRLLGRLPLLQRLPARLVGLGFRPEHIRSPIAG